MKNSDKPISAIVNSDGFITHQSKLEKEPYQSLQGLTKREYFAGLAMQGILGNSKYAEMLQGNNPNPVPSYVALISIELADELLKQLES